MQAHDKLMLFVEFIYKYRLFVSIKTFVFIARQKSAKNNTVVGPDVQKPFGYQDVHYLGTVYILSNNRCVGQDFEKYLWCATR